MPNKQRFCDYRLIAELERDFATCRAVSAYAVRTHENLVKRTVGLAEKGEITGRQMLSRINRLRKAIPWHDAWGRA